MSWKTIATVVLRPDADSDHLTAVAALAAEEGGHCHVLALGIDPLRPEAFYAGAAGFAVPRAFEEAIAASERCEKAALDILKKEGVEHDVYRAVAQMGAVADLVGQHAALSDAAVLPQPYAEGRDQTDVAVLEAMLFTAQIPVVVLPKGDRVPTSPKTVVVAWNNSPEAISAVRSALPLLVAADGVEITLVSPARHAEDRSDPGGELATILARHGAKANVAVLAGTVSHVEDAIIRHAQDTDADLIVMGAYGHTRFREAIFGGATRGMLEKADRPVLMAR